MPHRKAYRWVTSRLERVHLIMLGLAYMGTSFTWLGEPTASRAAGLAWLPFLNERMFGVSWLITGLAAVIIGIGISKNNNALGHAALFFTPATLSTIFFVSWLLWLLPDVIYEGGSETGYISGISFYVWSLFALSGALVWTKFGTVIYAATRVFQPRTEEDD